MTTLYHDEVFEAALEPLKEALVVIDAQGSIVGANPAAERLFGYSSQELYAHNVCMLVPPSERAKNGRRLRTFLEVAITKHGNTACDTLGLRKEGSTFPLRLVIADKHPRKSDLARVTLRAIQTGDQDKRKSTGRELRARRTLEALGYAVITTNVHGQIDYLNPVAQRLTGWSIQEARGQSLPKVLRILNEQSRTVLPLDAGESLQRGQPILLPKHSILISRCGQEYLIQHTSTLIHGKNGAVLGAVVAFDDVTEARRQAREVHYQAAHDALTGLVNRREFEQRLRRALASAKQHGMRHVLGYLDLDQFKTVNDTYGHMVGDELLKQIGSRLLGTLRARDTLARVGGDEFGLLIENCPLPKGRDIAESMVAAVRNQPFSIERGQYELGVSIGLVPITRDSADAQQLIKQADLACYTAKHLGRKQVHVFEVQNGPQIAQSTEVLPLSVLRSALENNHFLLYSQPIIPLASGHDLPLHYELLLRLCHPGRQQPVLPDAFIPAAERYGLMVAIDRWVIHTGLHLAARLLRDAPTNAGIVINLSGSSLNDHSLLAYVHQQLAQSSVAPDRLCFEITETAAIRNLTQAAHLIAAIKQRGCRFALDDFGSGLSSFSYLKHLPVDYLKIDGSFVRDMVEDTVDQAIVAAINQVSHLMGVCTIAEGVENADVLERVRTLGIDYAQGYQIGRPRPIEESQSLL